MTLDEIRPAIGHRYRHRRTGLVAELVRYRRGPRYGPPLARLRADSGFVWTGTTDEFWDSWVNSDLPNPEDN